MYFNKNMSQESIAKQLNCSTDTIRRNFKDYNISSKKPKEWLTNKEIILTDIQLEVINGALLGDGHLTKQKHGNSQFSYTSKIKNHVEYVYNYFNNYSTKEGIKEYSCYDKRTNKVYTRYTARTQLNISFTKLKKIWYKNNIKIIPNYLILTPLTCLVWYIGDGSLNCSKYSQYVKLSTNCFTYNELNSIIIPQLNIFNAELKKTEKNNQYIIYIPHHKIKEFLNYIGECPFDEYKYKWIYKEYKNKQPGNYKDKEQEFIKYYNQGYTYYSIAKIYNIEPNVVKYYLIKNNLYEVNSVEK